MKIVALELENFRSFKNISKTKFSETLNIFIGPNNSGKSTILKAILFLQRNFTFYKTDITIGEKNGKIILYYVANVQQNKNENTKLIQSIEINLSDLKAQIIDAIGNNLGGFAQSPDNEPDNYLYPFLSSRKVVGYNENINEENVKAVRGNLVNLYAKIDRLINPQFKPGNLQYIDACKKILGFEITTSAIGNGKKAVYIINNSEHIPLTSMGEGVTNILGLVTDLCVADDKIFIIEEPENDIHPKALKALLNLIIEKSKTNQFFISTHSNIVMKYLGSEMGAKLFHITNKQNDPKRTNLYISDLKEVTNDHEERKAVLEDMGYEFFDFDLWKGWLFLEESSAEYLIREFLIDWFVKPLKNQIRTFSTCGINGIIPKFEDFNRLFVFMHLEPTYKNKVWVIIDAGETEDKIIKELKEIYIKKGWNESNFSQFTEHNFEKYYPKVFQHKVTKILSIANQKLKQKAKKELLDEVKAWIIGDEERAKGEFSVSAKEVIDKLNQISLEIYK